MNDKTPEYQRCIDMLSIALVVAEQHDQISERLNRLNALLLAEVKQHSPQATDSNDKKPHLVRVK